MENGNLLIFDNGRDRGYSRVIELNPLTEEIVWEFRTEPPQAFYTASRGGAQRLPNGNTLITNSDSGEVIEITAEHEVVWRFLHPEIERRGLRRKLRRPAIYRMTRFDPALDRVNPFEPGVATTPRRLTTDPAEDRSPAWAPDGSRLLFASERDGSYDIYSIGSDGSDLERLTESPASDRSPPGRLRATASYSRATAVAPTASGSWTWRPANRAAVRRFESRAGSGLVSRRSLDRLRVGA